MAAAIASTRDRCETLSETNREPAWQLGSVRNERWKTRLGVCQVVSPAVSRSGVCVVLGLTMGTSVSTAWLRARLEHPVQAGRQLPLPAGGQAVLLQPRQLPPQPPEPLVQQRQPEPPAQGWAAAGSRHGVKGGVTEERARGGGRAEGGHMIGAAWRLSRSQPADDSTGLRLCVSIAREREGGRRETIWGVGEGERRLGIWVMRPTRCQACVSP
jgi:hypothetical protein